MMMLLLAAALTLTEGWEFRLEAEPEYRAVTIPHDWGMDYPAVSNSCPHQGDMQFVGKGYYRRTLDGLKVPAGGRVYLDFDGVMCRSEIKLNGRRIGGTPFGYTSEVIDITDALKPSGNLLEVSAENVPKSSRWYPGSGIFREVTVRICGREHVKPRTLFIRTVTANEQEATMAVAFEWAGGASNYTFKVKNPRLWSPETPTLYELELFGEKFRYGIRTAEFIPSRGFFLNGKHRKLNGVCMHHDMGPLGAAFDRDAARRQLTLLKEMGADAIRTSHNPPAAALLDLCDELGVLVLDEAFDMWEGYKGDYAQFFREWHERDLRELVRRDRSHPSVVMWSIGNELIEHQKDDPRVAIRIANELREIVRSEDATRPVMFGCYKVAPMTNGCQRTVDCFGANYHPFRYAEFARRDPDIGLVGSETCATVSSRGEYFFPIVASPIEKVEDLWWRFKEGMDNMVRGDKVSGYDLWAAHGNHYPPDIEFKFQEQNPQVYGEFVWSGFDYIGEPDPCAQTGGRFSYFGIFDLAGFPKDRYWLYRAHWRPDEPVAHLLPHWTWPGREGEITPVHLYSNADEAELFLNGVSLGRKRRGKYEYRFVWNGVKYAAGELKAVTWKNGKAWAEARVRTAGAPARIVRSVRKFGKLAFVEFKVVDAKGEFCPTANIRMTFKCTGKTRLRALGNGKSSCQESFTGNTMHTYNGLLLAIVEGEAEGLIGESELGKYGIIH